MSEKLIEKLQIYLVTPARSHSFKGLHSCCALSYKKEIIIKVMTAWASLHQSIVSTQWAVSQPTMDDITGTIFV